MGRAPKRKKRIIGWREWASLPDWNIQAIRVKVDTGARTSAIHAYKIRPFEKDGKLHVRFYVHPRRRFRKPEVMCEAPVLDHRIVTSSNGAKEERYVVRTRLKLGLRTWPIELTLTNRDELSFRMLLGRHALKGRYLVDSGASYRLGKLPPKLSERKN